MHRAITITITALGLGATASANQLMVPTQYATIQQAIDCAADGDEVLVDDGTYHEAVDFLGKAITLRSVNGPEYTVIDATGLDSSAVKCVSYEFPDTVLDGFTLTGGIGTVEGSDRFGGGMWIRISGPTVRHCIFLDNTADFGGGLACKSSWSTIEDCTFMHNTATGGGSYGGGGIGVQGGDLQILNCVFIENTTTVGRGGAVNLAGSESCVTNCAFFANDALYGGALINSQGEAILTNCSFNSNTASGAYDGVLSVSSGVQTTIVNCILWGNGGEEPCSEIADAMGATGTLVSHTDVEGGWDGPGEANIDDDPMFADADTGDLRLMPGSPCIDGGNTFAFLECGLDCDLDGNPRPVTFPDGAEPGLGPQWHTVRWCLTPPVDLGAYELQP